MASRRTFQYCGHCEQSVSLKTFKEHQRLYFYDGRWIKQRDMRSEGARSRSSSPLTISDPPTPIITNFSDIEEDAESTACNSLLAAEVSVDFEDELEVPTTDSDNEASSASTEAVKSEEIEYWQESESEVKSFLDDTDGPELPATLSPAKAEKTPTQQMEDETVLWIVLFTCVFQALHNLPHRATKWLLMFIGSLLVYLGKFSLPIQRIAASFPGTLYLRGQYLDEKVSNPTIIKHVVCSSCHTLYTMPKCSKTTASAQIKVCDKCSGQKPLFKKVVTGSKWIRLYPRLLFPACSLISSLGVLLASPGFADLCEEWRLGHATNSDQLNDVFNGKVWNEFLNDKGRLFFSEEFTIGLMLNVDWFNPFVHKVYSCGVIFLSILNLPRAIRYKRENVILVGLIPGPNEPSLTINSYLQLLVKELLLLWKGVQFQTSKGCKLYRCALLCVACDTPAARKVAGFLGHSADLGCLKCYKHFGTGQFGVMDYSGFDRSQWKLRTEKQHWQDASSVELAKSKRERSKLESEHGCRYSSLLALPYFDPIKMVIIDPMHNLYLGTAKRIFKLWTDREILDSKALTIINNRIASMCIPSGSSFSRLPSTIGSSSFTAEQWMVWVNYYSICCLHTLLPSNHMECWQLFVLASRLVSKYTISREEITLADALLLQFCKKFQTIFSKESITPNIHLHCHLHDCIKNFGPVSSFWLFPYERFNGVLGDEPTNNHSIELQVMKRFLEDNCYLRLLHSAPNSTAVSEFFRPVVANHAFQFGSVKTTSNYEQHQKTTSGINYVLPKKYTQEHLSSAEHMIVHQLYLKLYSSLRISFTKLSFNLQKGDINHSFRKTRVLW